MKTRHKIALARLAWYGVRAGRAMLGRGMAGDFRRGHSLWRLDLNEGIDFSIYLLGSFEPGTVRAYRRMIRAGDIVFDIGANIGAHTLIFARCVGPSGTVHAFEPTEYAFTKLLANVALNPELSPAIVCNHMLLAAGNHVLSPPALYSSWPMRPTGEVHEKHLGKLCDLRGAAVETLDSYVARHGAGRIDWIKIDVDGNETTVLEGALGTIHRFRPKIIMELSPYTCREAGHRFEDLIHFIRDCGYAFFDLERDRELPQAASELDALIPDGAGLNVLLRPAPEPHPAPPARDPQG